jgi:hypothetical protein
MAWYTCIPGDRRRDATLGDKQKHTALRDLRAVSPQARQEFFNSGSRAGTLLRALRTVASLMHYVAGHQLMIMGRLLAEI